MRILYVVPALVLLLPAAASAQIGGLVKRAKDAAQNKVGENKNLKSSDTFGPELTATSLDAVLKGLAATQAKLDQVKALEPERDRLNNDYAKSSNAHEAERQKYQEAADKIRRCQSDTINARSRTAGDAAARRMQSDPAERAKVMQASMDVSRQMAAAQQKGDTAEMRRLALSLAKAQGIDPAADTAAAIKACGARPPQPAWLVEQDSLRERSRRIDGQIRQLENDAATAGATTSGMAPKEYALARERLVNWYHETHGGSAIQAFGSDERKLLESRKGDIERYKKALQ